MINLVKVSKQEEDILNNLLQLYLHDISNYFKINFDSNLGKYEYDSLDIYFNSSNDYAFFIKEDNNIVGFALINLKEDENVIQEFFILNNYKKKGFGKEAAFKIFDMFKGNWKIASLPNSNQAEIFWKNVVSLYTNNNFNIEHVGSYKRALITFNNR